MCRYGFSRKGDFDLRIMRKWVVWSSLIRQVLELPYDNYNKHKLIGKKIIRTLSRPSITRERRKLKKYLVKLREGAMAYKEILNAYRSWKYSKVRWNVRHTIHRFDLLFDKLFNNNFTGGLAYD